MLKASNFRQYISLTFFHHLEKLHKVFILLITAFYFSFKFVFFFSTSVDSVLFSLEKSLFDYLILFNLRVLAVVLPRSGIETVTCALVSSLKFISKLSFCPVNHVITERLNRFKLGTIFQFYCKMGFICTFSEGLAQFIQDR